jgi:FtsH-binding integral membrane protein
MLSTLMVVNALIAAVFGVAFVVLPGQVTALYGPEVTPQLEYVAQLFGAALLAFAVLTWTARTAPDSEARRAILLALFIGDGVGFVVSLIGQLSGVMNALGWSTVVIYLLLALGFGYFCFVPPKATGEAGRVM